MPVIHLWFTVYRLSYCGFIVCPQVRFLGKYEAESLQQGPTCATPRRSLPAGIHELDGTVCMLLLSWLRTIMCVFDRR
jgi:hypothetical protein